MKSRGLNGFGEGIQDVRDALIAHVFGTLDFLASSFAVIDFAALDTYH